MIKTKYIFIGIAAMLYLYILSWLFNFVSPFASMAVLALAAIPVSIYLNKKKSKKNEKN